TDSVRADHFGHALGRPWHVAIKASQAGGVGVPAVIPRRRWFAVLLVALKTSGDVPGLRQAAGALAGRVGVVTVDAAHLAGAGAGGHVQPFAGVDLAGPIGE